MGRTMMSRVEQLYDPTYAQLLDNLGGRPDWMLGLSDRAAHALVRDGWTIERLSMALSIGADLTEIPNVGKKTALEINEFMRSISAGSS